MNELEQRDEHDLGPDLAKLRALARRRDPLFDLDRAGREHFHHLMTKLRGRREMRKLSQSEIAGRMRTTQSAISELEAGETDPHISTVIRYVAALEMEIGFTVREPRSW